MKYITRLLPFFIFGFLIALIISPLLAPGFILTLDLPPTDKLNISPITSTDFLLSVIFYLLHLVIPNYIIQKLILTAALTLSFWGMYRLVPVGSSVFRLFAGIFYMVNPFVYERLISGQWLLVLGYSLFPWIISSVIQFLKNSSIGNVIILSLLFSMLINISLHFFVLAVVFFLLYAVISLFADLPGFKRNFIGILKLSGFTLLFNLNWIIGIFITGPTLWQSFSAIGQKDLLSFQSIADPTFGLILNLLGGFGFWAEAHNYFISSKSLFPLWPAVTVALIGLSLLGFYLSMKKNNNISLTVTLGILFLLSLNLAAGIALANLAPIISDLYDKLPVLRGFREPQKLIAIVMFCFAYFGGIGFEWLNERIQAKKHFITAVFILLPLIYTLPIFFGFWGQLKPVFYPSSWKEVNEILKKDKDNFLTLFFPWHQYMRFRFANNVVMANPAMHYFDTPILFSSAYETKYLDSQSSRPETLHIEGLLNIERDGVNLLGDKVREKIIWGEALDPINVKYIMLAKEDDWKSYRFLDRSKDLEKISESDDLILYKNNHWSANGNKEIVPLEEYTKEDIRNLDEN